MLRERDKGVLVGTVESDGDKEGAVGEYLKHASRFRKTEPFYWAPPAGRGRERERENISRPF